MDKKEYTRKLYKSYKQMKKSNDLKTYVTWKKYIISELKQLPDDDLIGLYTYYCEQVVMHENRKSYYLGAPYVAILSAAASLLTGMIMYASNVMTNTTNVLATKAVTDTEWQVIFDRINNDVSYAEQGIHCFAAFAMLILIVGGVLLLKEYCEVISSNKDYVYDLKIKELIRKQLNKRKK